MRNWGKGLRQFLTGIDRKHTWLLRQQHKARGGGDSSGGGGGDGGGGGCSRSAVACLTEAEELCMRALWEFFV